MSDPSKKVRCRECKKVYYAVAGGKTACPYCYKASLIPAGTIVILQLKIIAGGYEDEALSLEGGLGTKAKSGAIYLRCKAEVISGKHRKKTFSLPIGLSGNKGDFWQNRGREIIRGILNSSQGLSASDNSRKAVYGRILSSYAELDKICFVAVVDIHKNQLGTEENIITKFLSGGKKNIRN